MYKTNVKLFLGLIPKYKNERENLKAVITDTSFRNSSNRPGSKPCTLRILTATS